MATTMVSPVTGDHKRSHRRRRNNRRRCASKRRFQIGTVQLSFHVGTVSPVVGLICGGDAGKLFEGVPRIKHHVDVFNGAAFDNGIVHAALAEDVVGKTAML